jgi:hypothetical protein
MPLGIKPALARAVFGRGKKPDDGSSHNGKEFPIR